MTIGKFISSWMGFFKNLKRLTGSIGENSKKSLSWELWRKVIDTAKMNLDPSSFSFTRNNDLCL